MFIDGWWHDGCSFSKKREMEDIAMNCKIFRGFFGAALLAIMVSSVTGCYYDDHHHWRGRDGYYDRDGYGRYRYDRDNYGYRRGYDRDDYWWRGRYSRDHDRDDD